MRYIFKNLIPIKPFDMCIPAVLTDGAEHRQFERKMLEISLSDRIRGKNRFIEEQKL